MKKLGKYSFGLGDRFGRQGHAQLKAIVEAGNKGIEITPVWNKSNREHMIIGTHPSDVRNEADQAVTKEGFTKPYFVDADHINPDTVDRFIESSDYFTIDVASFIGKRASDDELNTFISGARKYSGSLKIPGIRKAQRCSMAMLTDIAEKYLYASNKAGEVYRKIEKTKGKDNFITEISMDEVPQAQTPIEIFFILKMLSNQNIPVQTIAPKFSGRFNKGVDYKGDILNFIDEFENDLMVISHAVNEFGLPENLKISVHSGSDKFSIYPEIGSLLAMHDKGIHIKTAGTTWLEEVIGLAEAGGEALDFVKEIYTNSLDRLEELCGPYSDVIDINPANLASTDEVAGWNSTKFAGSLRHNTANPDFNPDMRQLMHVAYRLAAEKLDDFYRLLDEHQEVVAECVFENIYKRHISRLFQLK